MVFKLKKEASNQLEVFFLLYLQIKKDILTKNSMSFFRLS